MPKQQTPALQLLFTGASSKLGSQVLEEFLRSNESVVAWCGTHRKAIDFTHPRKTEFPLDLESPVDLSPIEGVIDLAIHFAGITHSTSSEAYEKINHIGTVRLAEAVQLRGCRSFVYISTRCIGTASGAYGESKRAAEDALLSMNWESLLILRPGEIFGARSNEGIDRFIAMGRDLHIVPLFFGNKRIRFSPMHFKDFLRICRAALEHRAKGVTILELCGPEVLTGTTLALRVAKRYYALPIPTWLPALSLVSRLAAHLGYSIFTPDQIARLTGEKSADHPSDDPALNFNMIRFLDP